jgi:cytochrome c biogenesis protein CcmG/thiol:disulfide interchange protein DsbE
MINFFRGRIFILSFFISFSFSQEKIPNLRLKMINGKYAKLHDFLKDGPMIIDFWATWCEPCKKQMKYLNIFNNHFKKTGFKVLAVNTDTPKSMSKVKSYVRTKKFEFEVAVDPNSQIKKKMKVLQMPTTILVDQSGEIIFRHQGYLPGDEHDILKEIYDLLDKTEVSYEKLDLNKDNNKQIKTGADVDF